MSSMTKRTQLKLKTLHLSRGFLSSDFPPLTTIPTIHTWAHLVLATHMKAGWIDDPQVVLTTLKVRGYTCKDTSTQTLKVCSSPQVS